MATLPVLASQLKVAQWHKLVAEVGVKRNVSCHFKLAKIRLINVCWCTLGDAMELAHRDTLYHGCYSGYRRTLVHVNRSNRTLYHEGMPKYHMRSFPSVACASTY